MGYTKRILLMIPLMLAVSFLSFGLVRMAPGGPFDRERKPASPEIERRIREKYHLDEPVLKQYGRYLMGILGGDLGPSLKYRNHTVTEIVLQGLPISMGLGLCAFLFALGLGIPLGLYTAATKGGFGEVAGTFLAVLLVCVPGFVIGPLLVMELGIRWRLLPVALLESPAHWILPVVTLGLYFAGRVARLLREGMLSVRNADFVMAARSKGLSDLEVMLRHTFRIGVLPVVSYSGPMLADLMTGSFVVENLFQIPGLGVFMVNSSLSRDYTMIVGLVLVYAWLLLVMNLVVDMAYRVFDPRIRHED